MGHKNQSDGTGPSPEAAYRALLAALPVPTAQSAARIVCAQLTVASAEELYARGSALQAVLIVWCEPQGETAELARLLYRIAGRGAWNHLRLPVSGDLADRLEHYAQGNPNIIHSRARDDASERGLGHIPAGHAPYGRTRPLPGRPLWQVLADQLHLQACLDHWGTARLLRTHLLDNPVRLHLAGSALEYHFVPPAQLPPGGLDEVCAMVEAGGSVSTVFVRHNLERAFLVAYVTENGVLVGNSSLKQPRTEYIEAVSRQSGIDLADYLERGYTSVRPEYRGLGIGAKLLAGLTARAGDHKIFSVIGEENLATQKMAIRNRTRRVAVFHSARAGKEVGVWIPEWMVPQGVRLPPQPALQ